MKASLGEQELQILGRVLRRADPHPTREHDLYITSWPLAKVISREVTSHCWLVTTYTWALSCPHAHTFMFQFE